MPNRIDQVEEALKILTLSRMVLVDIILLYERIKSIYLMGNSVQMTYTTWWA